MDTAHSGLHRVQPVDQRSAVRSYSRSFRRTAAPGFHAQCQHVPIVRAVFQRAHRSHFLVHRLLGARRSNRRTRRRLGHRVSRCQRLPRVHRRAACQRFAIGGIPAQEPDPLAYRSRAYPQGHPGAGAFVELPSLRARMERAELDLLSQRRSGGFPAAPQWRLRAGRQHR